MIKGSQAFTADSRAFTSPRVQRDALVDQPAPPSLRLAPAGARVLSPGRIGVITNMRSHRNRMGKGVALPEETGIMIRTPRSQAALGGTLAAFAAAKIELLVIDGGDGTVRDVLTAAPTYFGDRMPQLAVVPSGKTNALAFDLGVPNGWTIADAVAAAEAGSFRQRAPLEIRRVGNPDSAVRGFLFGAGAFVRATALAQRTHRAGAFNGLAVGLSLTLALTQTMFGTANNVWRRGERMTILSEDGHVADRAFYIVLGSTLENLPLGLKPFGHPRPGLKMLAVDAPPRRMMVNVPALLTGSERPGLERDGYHRGDPRMIELSVDSGFILDGEHYDGGTLTITTGEPLLFAVP